MDTKILINNLGLSEKEAAVYLAILELGSSSIQPIATRAGVKRTSIYYFIDHLVELGLIEQAKIRGRMHYKALPPDYMVSLQKQRLDEIQQAMPQFMSVFNSSTSKPKISYYEGTEQMQNIPLEELHCKKEALYIWPARDIIDMLGGPKFMEKLDRLRRANGTFIKAVRFQESEIDWKGSGGTKDDMRELRLAPPGTDFPMAIGIYDTGKVGFMTTKKEGFGIMIESEELAQSMKILFQLFWDQSTPAE